MMKNTLIAPLHSFQWCFGIWETGVEVDLTNALFQKDFNVLFHTLTTTLMKITILSTRTSHNTTTVSSMSSRTLGDIFSWIAKLVHFTLTELVSKRLSSKRSSMIIMIWWLLLASERKAISSKLLDIAQMKTTHASDKSLVQSSRSTGEDQASWHRGDWRFEKSKDEDDTCVRLSCWTEVCFRIFWYCWWLYSPV